MVLESRELRFETKACAKPEIKGQGMLREGGRYGIGVSRWGGNRATQT